MKLRPELEPRLDIAEKLYPAVLALIEEGEGNEDATAQSIAQLVGKKVLPEILFEYWGWTDAKNLAYILSLPSAVKVENFTKEELTTIIGRILEEDSVYADALQHYYLDVIHKNLPCPNASDYIFLRNLGTAEEMAEAIWQYKPILL